MLPLHDSYLIQVTFVPVGVKVQKPKKMPEHRKIATKTPKVKSSAVKRTENTDNVSLASSDGRLSQYLNRCPLL